MAGKSRVPEKMYDAILERAGEGLGTREIAAWLAAHHSVNVAHSTIARLLERLRAERSEVTRAVIAEKVGQHVTADLDRAERLLKKQEQVVDALHAKIFDEEGRPRDEALMGLIGKTPLVTVFTAANARADAMLARKMELSGAGAEKDTPISGGSRPAIDAAAIAALERRIIAGNSGGGDDGDGSAE